jgi:hypothetical protein
MMISSVAGPSGWRVAVGGDFRKLSEVDKWGLRYIICTVVYLIRADLE